MSLVTSKTGHKVVVCSITVHEVIVEGAETQAEAQHAALDLYDTEPGGEFGNGSIAAKGKSDEWVRIGPYEVHSEMMEGTSGIFGLSDKDLIKLPAVVGKDSVYVPKLYLMDVEAIHMPSGKAVTKGTLVEVDKLSSAARARLYAASGDTDYEEKPCKS